VRMASIMALAEDPPWEAKKLIFIKLASKIKMKF
jgi:hypothetical protein